MILLPLHACGLAYGELDRANVATCREHRRFLRRGDRWEIAAIRDGCGATFALCPTCGNRNVINGGRCAACNGGLQ